jgi:hypothetical protein
MWILSFPGQALSLLSRVCNNSWALQKTTVLGNCPIITYDLWNANSIHCCRWNIAAYEWAIFLNLRNYVHFSPWLVFSKMSCPTLSLSLSTDRGLKVISSPLPTSAEKSSLGCPRSIYPLSAWQRRSDQFYL